MARRSPSHRGLRGGLFWGAVTVLFLVVLVAGAILVNGALKAQINALGVLALLFLFAISFVTSLATTEVIPWDNLSWRILKRPKVLSAIGGILLLSFGTLASFLPLLEQNGGVEAALGQLTRMMTRIDETTTNTSIVLDKVAGGLERKGIIAGEATLVERRIDGIWGQSDCANTYLFKLDPAWGVSRVLRIKSFKSSHGLDDLKQTFVFKSASDQFGNDGFARSILSTQEIEGDHPGYLVDFTLVSAGGSEKLFWGSASPDQNALELRRCSNEPSDAL